MIHRLTRLEARWVGAVSGAFAPQSEEVDYAGALDAFLAHVDWSVALGMRAGFFLLNLAPLWYGLRPRTLNSLPLDERCALLDRMTRSRSYLVRELVLLSKTIAAMALFRVPAVRAASGYDREDA